MIRESLREKLTEAEVNELSKGSGLFGILKPGSSIRIRERGSENVIKNYQVKTCEDWQEVDDNVQRSVATLIEWQDGTKIEKTIVVFKNTSTNEEWVEDEQGNRLEEFKGDVETISYFRTIPEKEQGRSPAKMQNLLEYRERHTKTSPMFDENGEQVCEVDYIPGQLDITEIRTAPFTNVDGQAEKTDEHVYVTTEEGIISKERLTRREAREQERRYLLVTALIQHGQDVLLQKRSPEKKIDPDKFSSSAHGVAKELRIGKGKRVNNIEAASLINMALEINEELRHGQETTPFRIKIWPGTYEELIEYGNQMNIDDPDTIYLVPEGISADDTYPIGKDGKKRTRVIHTGIIFSKERPKVSIDPAELTKVEWKRPSEFSDDLEMTEDLQKCTDLINDHHLKQGIRSGRVGDRLAKMALRDLVKGKN